jgi:malate dehydrogenase (oxaloacetate-decarboxylating)
MPTMEDVQVFPRVAAAVADQAVKDGVARNPMPHTEVLRQAEWDIMEARETTKLLMEREKIKPPPKELIDRLLAETTAEIAKMGGQAMVAESGW